MKCTHKKDNGNPFAFEVRGNKFTCTACGRRVRLPKPTSLGWSVRDKGKRDTPLIHLLWVNWVYYGKKYLLGKEV